MEDTPRSRLSLFPEGTHVNGAGRLCLEGQDFTELADRFGTPLYVLHVPTIRACCTAYKDALAGHYPGTSSISYAAKALMFSGLARLINSEGLSIDAVSEGEYHIATVGGGVTPDRVHFHGNNKPPAELERAVREGVGRVVVDGFDELPVLEGLAAKLGRRQKVWLRLNPGIAVNTHSHIQTGMADSKFGFPLVTGDAKRALTIALESEHLEPVGLHIHLGSQIFDTAPIARAADAALDFASEAKRLLGWEMQEFSPGGGLAVPYTPQMPSPVVDDYVASISGELAEGCRRCGLQLPHMVLEPGRSIVARSGVALYRVGGRKDVAGLRTYLSVDGGMSDNPRVALYASRYTALVADYPLAPFEEVVTVAGRYCETGDVLAREVSMPRAKAGDVLAMPVSGAYHIPLSSNYNASLRPAVLFLEDGEARLTLRRESLSDLMARDVA